MELAAVLDELGAVPLDEVEDAALHALLLELEQQGQRLEAIKASTLAVWDSRQVWASDGSKAPGARLARDAHRSPAATRTEVKRAKRLRTMPATAAAFEAGRIAVDHVDRLVTANQPLFRDAFIRDEELLIGFAVELAFDDFARTIAYWLQLADDDLAQAHADHLHNRRTASCSRTLGGTRDIQARLDPIGGAIYENELLRLERILFEADWAQAEETHGVNTRTDHLARTTPQRRADAMVLMAERSAAMPPDAKQGRVLVSVLLDYDTLLGRVCELMDGTVLTPGDLLPHLTRADLERIVFSGSKRVIEVGARTPFFTGALRRAIEVRDRHCQHPGCRVPADHCDVDHITERCDGGPTTQANGRLLCPTHNRQCPGRRPRGTNPESGPAPGSEDEDGPVPEPEGETERNDPVTGAGRSVPRPVEDDPDPPATGPPGHRG